MSEINSHKVKENGSANQVAVLPGAGAMVITSLHQNAASIPSNVPHEDDDNQAGNGYYPWGHDDNWPTDIRKKLEKSTTAYPLIFKAVSLMFGDGIHYYREVKDGDKLQKEFFESEEIDEFIRDNKINIFMLEQLMDYKFYGNAFCELILSRDSKSIVNIFHLESEFTRLKQKGDKSRRIEYVGYGDCFGYNNNGQKPSDISLLTRRMSYKDVTKIQKNGKFAMHTYFPSPGRTIYAKPPHAGLYRKDGWLDFANSVPEIMNAIVDNQINIKYHIKIPYQYWTSKYKDWDILPNDKRKKLYEEQLSKMDEFLSGKENQASTFISHYAVDPITKKEVSGWEIIAIDDKVKKDAYIPSVQEADAQIARAIGLDSSMSFIQGQGNSMGAGSGSDKRIGMQNTIALTKSELEVLLEPLYLIRDFNKWDKNIKFGFVHKTPTTLDKNPTGQKTEM